MIPRNFNEDLKKSNNIKLKESWIKLIKIKFGDNCEIFWKDDITIQKAFGTDIIIKTSKGRRYSVELKTRNFNCFGKDWIMEIVHQGYNEENRLTRKKLYTKEGWIYSTTAEYIFHGTLNLEGTDIIECIFYSVMPFKCTNWKSEFNKYQQFWLTTKFSNGNFQLTLNKLIPKAIISKEANEFWEYCK